MLRASGNSGADPRDELRDAESAVVAPTADRIAQAVSDLVAGRAREVSFRILFFAYHDRLLGFFRRRNLPLEEAEDLVQESFIAMQTAISSYRGEAPFKHWLFGLAANVYRRNRRYRSAEKRSGQEIPLEMVENPAAAGPRPAELLSSRDPSPLDETLVLERRRRLRQAADQLPRQMRRCVILRWVEGYDTKDIAKILALKPATVRVQLFRARGQLRQLLKEPQMSAVLKPEDKA